MKTRDILFILFWLCLASCINSGKQNGIILFDRDEPSILEQHQLTFKEAPNSTCMYIMGIIDTLKLEEMYSPDKDESLSLVGMLWIKNKVVDSVETMFFRFGKDGFCLSVCKNRLPEISDSLKNKSIHHIALKKMGISDDGFYDFRIDMLAKCKKMPEKLNSFMINKEVDSLNRVFDKRTERVMKEMYDENISPSSRE